MANLPGYHEFYDADTVIPKDGLLNFDDFKTQALIHDRGLQDAKLNVMFWGKARNGVLNFEQYSVIMKKIKTDAVSKMFGDKMAAKMTNPDFKIFNSADTSDPKDGYLTFDEWKTEAEHFMPTATHEELQADFDQFKNTDTSDENADDMINFEEFEKAIKKVRER